MIGSGAMIGCGAMIGYGAMIGCRESLSSPRSSALLGLGQVSPQERLPALEPDAHASRSAPSIPAGPAAPFTPRSKPSLRASMRVLSLDARLALGKHQMDALNAPLPSAESSRRLKAQEQQDAAAPFTPRKVGTAV